jgi:molecular chaperone GrpE (heat shock protein)
MPEPTFREILFELRQFETAHYRSDPEAAEALIEMTYRALVALLEKLMVERITQEGKPRA